MSHRVLGPQFFHGSDRHFEVGDIIDPRHSSSDIDEAHATNDIRWASSYGGMLYEVEPVDHHEKVNEHEGVEHWVSRRGGWRVKDVIY